MSHRRTGHKRSKLLYLFLVMSILLLLSCQITIMLPIPRVTPQPTPEIRPLYEGGNITVSNAAELSEITTLSSMHGEPVAALSFAGLGEEILAACCLSGSIVRWQLGDNQRLVDALNVEPFGCSSVAFDQAGKLAAVGGGSIPPTQAAGYAASFKGGRLWDLRQGELIHQSDDLSLVDVLISPNGKWYAEVDNGGFIAYQTGEWGHYVNAFVWMGEPWTAAGIDSTGEWVAYASADGRIDIEPTTSSRGREGRGGILGLDRAEPTLDIAFDPFHRYVATVTTNTFALWELRNWDSLVLEQALANPTSLGDVTFSPDGKLLAVATAAGWQIWSVKDRQLLLENLQATYAVAFSPDGHLFAWGDANGVVHIWGAPDQGAS